MRLIAAKFQMTYILEIPDAEAPAITEAIQQLSADVKLTPLGTLRGLQPPKPPTTAQLVALRALAEPLQPGDETAAELEARIYGDRRDAPREVEL